jgi:threonyl-tRNA synthetase
MVSHSFASTVFLAFPHEPIFITLPDGGKKEGIAFETTPLMVAKMLSNSLPDKVIVAKVKYSKRVATLDHGLVDAMDDKQEGEEWIQWDAWRPLEGDCELTLLKFEDPEGQEVFWHSSAHILGEALERAFGVHLCHGPPTEQGFFYDSYTGQHDIFKEENYPMIEAEADKVAKEKQTFSRLVLSKVDALKMFGKNPFKVSLITNKIPDNGNVTVYKCGNLIDLCTGPHVPHTGKIKAFKVTKNSSAYWLGKATNDSLQRIYGITFPNPKMLKEWVHIQEEALKRGHKRVGEQQELFHFSYLSPGSAFFHPRGALIYNKLIDIIRHQYKIRQYKEVVTPNMFNLKLWKMSGHYANYKDNIFLFKSENQGFGVKPMNCPGHCLMFNQCDRSYRDLPLRFGDFGVLHRNEISGALHGLTRVRRFQQDDAHIFCTPDQITKEVLGVLDFLKYVYDLFGLQFELELSTRPESFLGDIELWNAAEAQLEDALNSFGMPWKLNPGDGAFYGPKIDIKVMDCLKRANQCGTVQLDFQLPIRFNMQYTTDNSEDAGSVASLSKNNSMQSENPAAEAGPGLKRGKTM